MKNTDIQSLIKQWQNSGVVSAEQAQAMSQSATDYVSKQSGTKFINILMYIGVAALSAGVLLFIASNWDAIPRTMKLLLTLLMPIVPLCYAYWQVVMKQNDGVLGRAASVFGVALIGGSLSLIAQIYNLEANMVSFLWTWTLLAMPFVFIFRSKENVFFSTILTGAAFVVWLFDWATQSSMEESAIVILMTVAVLAYTGASYGMGIVLRTVPVWSVHSRFIRLTAATAAVLTLFVTTW